MVSLNGLSLRTLRLCIIFTSCMRMKEGFTEVVTR